MIVYIPINSNDYNNVFSTLSISPRAFYSQRGYSFRRSAYCQLNPFEEYILAFENPVFHQMDNDTEEGYPILIKTEIDDSDLYELEIINSSISKLNVFAISKTIFLYDEFRVIFRNKNEQSEIEAKTLKSIETKYTALAKKNSAIAEKNSFYIYRSISTEDIKHPKVDVFECFKCERIYNKVAGAITGYALGKKNELNPEIIRLKNLSRDLNNTTSLLINKVGENDFEIYKERIINCLNNIEIEFNKSENIETTIILSSNDEVNSELISKLKRGEIYNHSIFSLILEGLINQESDNNLPIQLNIEKCRRDIKQKFNSKYPEKYIRKINASINKLKLRITKTLAKNLNQNRTDFSKIMKYDNDGFSLPSNITFSDEKYIYNILDFFIIQDEINNQDDFFRNRKSIIAKLGQVLKEEHPEFIAGYKERDYLINLYNSFESLTSKFNILGSNSILFQSLAVLFTSGRDLNKYLNEIESLEFSSTSIPLALWGALYGFASLPKTETEILLGNISECKVLLKNLKIAQGVVSKHNKSFKKPFVTEKTIIKPQNFNSYDYLQSKQLENKKKPQGFLETLKDTKYDTNKQLMILLKTILSNQSNNALLEEDKDKVGDFINEINRKDNKIKGVGVKGIMDLINRYHDYYNISKL